MDVTDLWHLTLCHRFTLASSLGNIHNSLLSFIDCKLHQKNSELLMLGLTSSWMLLCYRGYAVAVHSMAAVCSLVWVLTSHEGCMSTIVLCLFLPKKCIFTCI